jgi:hypothetical protein
MQHPKQLFVVASLDYMHVEAEVRCLLRAVIAHAESEPPCCSWLVCRMCGSQTAV